MKMIRLLNFIKIVRLAKVIEETKKIKNIRRSGKMHIRNRTMNMDPILKVNKEIEKENRAKRSIGRLTTMKWKEGKPRMSQLANSIFQQVMIQNNIDKSYDSESFYYYIDKIKEEGIRIFGENENVMQKNRSFENEIINPIKLRPIPRRNKSHNNLLDSKNENECTHKDAYYYQKLLSKRKILFPGNSRKQISLSRIETSQILSKSTDRRVSFMHSLIGFPATPAAEKVISISTDGDIVNKVIFEKKELNTSSDTFRDKRLGLRKKMPSIINEEDHNMHSGCNDSGSFKESMNLKKNKFWTSSSQKKTSIAVTENITDTQNYLIANPKYNSFFKFNAEYLVNKDDVDWGQRFAEALIKYIKKNKSKHINEASIGEKLTESINRKVVLMIMVLLVILPVIDDGYILTFYSDYELKFASGFCLQTMAMFYNTSLENPNALKMLNKVINNCVNITWEDEISPYILYLNFSKFETYRNVVDKYGNTSYRDLLPNETYYANDYDNIIRVKRKSRDYLFINSISFDNYYSNIVQSGLTARLGLFRTLFVSLLLVLSSVVFTNDVTVYVIKPIDLMTAKLHLYINNTDIIFKINPMNIKINAKSIILLQNKNKKIKDPGIKNLETYWIDKLIKRLIRLVSLSVGKPGTLY